MKNQSRVFPNFLKAVGVLFMTASVLCPLGVVVLAFYMSYGGNGFANMSSYDVFAGLCFLGICFAIPFGIGLPIFLLASKKRKDSGAGA